jgi:hypothetical protein
MRARERSEYQPTAVYVLAARLRARGIDLGDAVGPWRADERETSRPGRTSLHRLPVVTNERTALLVDTRERAADVAGLLNLCGVDHLDPVPELVPGQAPDQGDRGSDAGTGGQA